MPDKTAEKRPVKDHVELWTVKEAAAFWRVAPPTILRWIEKKLLTNYPTPGGAIRLKKAEVTGLVQPATK